MQKKELFRRVLQHFESTMDSTETELHFSNPFELAVAVVLSAQCTDKRINQVTPALFRDFPTPEALAATTPEVIYEYIKSVSYPNNKASHLVGMGKMLMEQYGGEVPSTLEELIRLPGVGRKTANVILSVVWGEAKMAVDTHVFRVSHRLGLVPNTCTTPLAVEQVLTKNFTKEEIPDAHHWLILHGRYTCTALRPKCDKCGLCHLCKAYKTQTHLKTPTTTNKRSEKVHNQNLHIS